MPRLILLMAVGAVVYLLLRRIAHMPPHLRRAEYIKLAAGVGIVGVVLLTIAGKMHWIGAAITGLLVFMRQSLPLLLRVFPVLAQWSRSTKAGAQKSTVSTDTVRMHLDHESGALSGEVLAGPFKGWRLHEMDREQLRDLCSYCDAHDTEALQLLEGYLEQRFQDDASAQESASAKSAIGGGSMNRREALEVLGLEESADQEAIVQAHRKLIQKLHPDRGGSDYLAAKINQAKDLLLG